MADQNDGSISKTTICDALGRVIEEDTPAPDGSGSTVATTYGYTNGVKTSATDAQENVTYYTYQPDGSVKSISRGSRSITVNRTVSTSSQIEWTCSNALGETLWTKDYYPGTGVTTFIPYGQAGRMLTTTPSLTGGLLSLVAAGPFWTTTNTWMDGTPYRSFYQHAGMLLSSTNTINAYGEVTQSAMNPGGNSSNAITTSFSSLGMPTQVVDIDGTTSIANSFSSSGLSQSITANSHASAQSFSSEGLSLGRTGYGSPDQTWSTPSFNAGKITRTMTTGAGAVDMVTSPLGNLLDRHFPDTSHETFAFNSIGGQTSWTNAAGVTLNLTPNLFNEPTTAGTFGTIGYDNAGRVNGMADASGSCTLMYQNGELTTSTYNSGLLAGQFVARHFNGFGLLDSITLPGGVTIGYSYDTNGAVHTITTAAGVTGTYGDCDSVTGRAQNLSIGPLSVASTFDGKGRNTSQSSTSGGSTWAFTDRQYDADGHCKYVDTPDGSWTYTYDGTDNHGYLHTASGWRTLTYNFDAAGRPAGATDFRPLTAVNSGTVTVLGSVTPGAGVTINGTATTVNATSGLFSQDYTPAPNAWHSYVITGTVASSGTTYSTQQVRRVFVPPLSESLGYNGNGALGSDARWSYGWNDLDQLVTITETNGYSAATATTITCTYDLQGRRVQKLVKIGGKESTRTTTLWDGWRPTMELVHTGTGDTLSTKFYYTWGPDVSGSIDGSAGIGGLVEIMAVSGTTITTSLPVYDGIGNIVAYVEGHTGAQVATYKYGSFGELLTAYGPRVNQLVFGYQTKERDQETGNIYFIERYLRPNTQTWLSRDPEREDGGVNQYAYCGDDPVGNFDAIGEDWVNRPAWKYIYDTRYGTAYITHDNWVWVDGPATPENLLLSFLKGLGEGSKNWGQEKMEEAEAIPGLIEEIKENPSTILQALGINSSADVLELLGKSAASGVTGPIRTFGNLSQIVDGAYVDAYDRNRPNYAMEELGVKAGPTVASAVLGYIIQNTAKGAVAILSPSQARQRLRASLGPDPYGGFGQAHHIFGVADHQSALGLRLQGWGIDLNSAENGVWLPTEKGLDLFATIHSGGSTRSYREYTKMMLGAAKSREEALSIMRYMKNELQTGYLKINGAGQ